MLAGGWAALLKPVVDAEIGKKRAATPLTTKPISKCAKLALADEKKVQLAEKKKDQAEKKESKELSKAQRIAEREEKALEKEQKKQEMQLKKDEKAAAKAAKDAHPKKPRTGYFIFCASARTRLVEATPELKSKVTELSKIMAAEWKELSEEAKKGFDSEAAAERTEYLAACEAAGVAPDPRHVPKEKKEKVAKEPKEKGAKKPRASKKGKAAAELEGDEAAEAEAADAEEELPECPEGLKQEDFEMVLECQKVFTAEDWEKMNPEEKSFFDLEEAEKEEMFATWRAHLKLRKEEAAAQEQEGGEAMEEEAAAEADGIGGPNSEAA